MYAIICNLLARHQKTGWQPKSLTAFIAEPDGLRIANPTWRPFVVKVSKIARRHGKEPDKAAVSIEQQIHGSDIRGIKLHVYLFAAGRISRC